MVFSGMNRYIAKHGRWLFGIFAIVISFSFVMYFSRVSLMDLFIRRGGSNTLTLLGRKVTMDDRILERDRQLMIAALRNPAINIRRTNYPLSAQQLITQLALSYAADDMGIAVSDAAVAKYIKKVPAFQTKGAFDLKKYRDFVKNKLEPAHLTKKDLDEAVREAVKVDILRKTIVDNVIIPEDEIREAYKNLNGKVIADRIVFNAADLAAKLKVTDKQLRNFFESRKNEYRTPPAAKGLLVPFRYVDFRAEAQKSVTFDEISKYYDSHKMMFIKMNASKNPLKKKKSGTQYQPLAEVTPRIRKKLVDSKAKELAFAAAQKFSDKLYNATVDVFYDEPDKKAALLKCVEIFKKASDEAKIEPNETGWLIDGSVPNAKGFQADAALVSALNGLKLDNPLSEPVKGGDSVYVALLEAKRAPRPETFEEAKSKVRESYVREKSLVLVREAARNAALKISKRLAKGAKIADVAKELNLKLEKLTITPYSRVSQAESAAAFGTPVGKLSKVVPTRTGASLFYVESKPAPSMKEYKKRGRFFAYQYKMMKRGAIFRSYMESLLATSSTAKKKK